MGVNIVRKYDLKNVSRIPFCAWYFYTNPRAYDIYTRLVFFWNMAMVVLLVIFAGRPHSGFILLPLLTLSTIALGFVVTDYYSPRQCNNLVRILR
jgi:hypothetical protein